MSQTTQHAQSIEIAHCPTQPSWPPSVRLRLRVRLHRWRLDRRLADGFWPEASEESALRARQLTDSSTRSGLARALRGAVSDAESAHSLAMYSAVPICRKAVLSWRQGLLGLADRLEQDGPLNPCGVARTVLLLTDGTGPLYNPSPFRSMEQSMWWIADGLQPHGTDGSKRADEAALEEFGYGDVPSHRSDHQ